MPTFLAVAKSWLSFQRAHEDKDIWALDDLDDKIRTDPASAWEIVSELCRHAQSDDELCAIGAGPVEDLVRQYGETAVQQLEKVIELDHRFATVAACVWAWGSSARPSIDRLLEKYEQRHL